VVVMENLFYGQKIQKTFDLKVCALNFIIIIIIIIIIIMFLWFLNSFRVP
jgi:hypothetical protein